MLNTDWIAKRQLNVNSINLFYKHLKRNQSSIIYLYNLTDLIKLYNYTDLMLDHVFHASIIAHCQQNRYVRFPIHTDLFTLMRKQQIPNFDSTLIYVEITSRRWSTFYPR